MGTTSDIQQKKLFTGLDVMKFIMALFIMNIHLQFTNFMPDWCYRLFIEPIEQCAVPLFFILSAFFLFRKVNASEQPSGIFRHFFNRLIILYLIWMVVWAPYVVMNPDYHQASNAIEVIILFLKDFFFYAVYGNSWFFPALMFCVLIVYGLKRLMGNRWMWTIPTLLFIYMYCIDILPATIRTPLGWYYQNIAIPTQSFPRGIFWVMLGYYLSLPKAQGFIEKLHVPRLWVSIPFIVLLIGSIGLMGVEGCIGPQNSALSVLLYPLLAWVLFACFYRWNVGISPTISQWFRAMSVLTFVMHGTAEKIFRVILHWHHGPILYLTMLACCLVAGSIIYFLSKKRAFHFLKYAY